jgi:hypothetical protein
MSVHGFRSRFHLPGGFAVQYSSRSKALRSSLFRTGRAPVGFRFRSQDRLRFSNNIRPLSSRRAVKIDVKISSSRRRSSLGARSVGAKPRRAVALDRARAHDEAPDLGLGRESKASDCRKKQLHVELERSSKTVVQFIEVPIGGFRFAAMYTMCLFSCIRVSIRLHARENSVIARLPLSARVHELPAARSRISSSPVHPNRVEPLQETSLRRKKVMRMVFGESSWTSPCADLVLNVPGAIRYHSHA